MSFTKKKKTLGTVLWEFFRGDNRNPTTTDIVKCLAQGSIARAKVKVLYKEQLRIENEREKITKLQEVLRTSRKGSIEYERALRKIFKILQL
jgi:hypothetical protein